jgi:predicted nucleotidyltransferase component of viral defense system
MELFDDKVLFSSLCSKAALALKIPEYAIEKDFYAMLVLEEATGADSSVVFKGGTSLSKGYGLINRFSEDLDLSVNISKTKTNNEQELKSIIRTQINPRIKKLSFVDKTLGEDKLEINSLAKSYYCLKYSIKNWVFKINQSSPQIKVESTVLSRPYPTENRTICSYLFDYLKTIGEDGKELIKKFKLHDFVATVQKPERTFIDKTFALADYYLSNQTNRNSRHLYDLYKMLESGYIILDDSTLKDLARKVYKERRQMDRTYSARRGIDVEHLLAIIMSDDVYKDDYEKITTNLLFGDENVTYSNAITCIPKILSSHLLDFAK